MHQAGSIHTVETGECCKSGQLSPKSLLLNSHQHPIAHVPAPTGLVSTLTTGHTMPHRLLPLLSLRFLNLKLRGLIVAPGAEQLVLQCAHRSPEGRV